MHDVKITLRILAFLIPLLCSCKPNAEPILKEETYETKTIFFTREDDASPMGHWKTNIEYPVILNNSPTIKKINASILQMTTEFQCDDQNGDKQFHAEVTLTNGKIFSLKFSDSWYCPGMPYTKGRTGAITYNLKTGEEIEINNEIERSMSVELNKKLNSGLTKALKIKQIEEGCPTESGYFYLTRHDVVFVNKSDDQETLQCEVEFRINREEMKKYITENSALL